MHFHPPCKLVQGCFSEDEIMVQVLSLPTVDLNATIADCGVENAEIISNVQGGLAPYEYLWSNDATSGNLTNIGAGFYSLTITDSNGCTVKSEILVTSENCAELGN